MKKLAKTALWASVRVLLEIVMLFPFLFIFAHKLVGDTPMLWVFIGEFCLFAVLGVITRLFIPVIWAQLLLGVPLCVAIVIFAAKAFGGIWPNAYVIQIIAAPFLILRGKQHAEHPWDVILPNYILFALLVIQLIIIAFVRLNGGLVGTVLTAMYISVPIAYVTAYVVLNRINLINLIDEAQSRSSSSSLAIAGGMDKQNRLLLIILLIIGTALSLGTVIYNVAVWLVDKFVWVLKLLFKLLFDFDMTSPTSGQYMGGEEEAAGGFDIKPGNMEFWEPFFKVISYIAVAIVIIAFIYLLYRFVRWLIRTITDVIAKFSEQSMDGLEGGPLFEDTKESLIDMSQLPGMYAGMVKDKISELIKREPGYDDMPTPAEKLKYLLKKSLKKAQSSGYAHRTSYTAREAVRAAGEAYPPIKAGGDELADKYDAFRYAGREPDLKELDELHKELGNL